MGDPRGFLKHKRQSTHYRPLDERLKDYNDVSPLRSDEDSLTQAGRCMDCGTPFCHGSCPVGNYIPEWNDLVFGKHWEKALQLLMASNNLPEITGRLCPALCEHACVLGINDEPVTIRENELAIVEHGFKTGLIKPRLPRKRTGRKVAVIGSGPAGLACADQLNKAGHTVVVFEKDGKAGGWLRYGIPDFKLEKWVIDRRVDLMKNEGIEFRTGVEAGRDVTAGHLLKEFDALCLAGGSRVPRDLAIEGRELKGIHFATDYLVQSNRRVAGETFPEDRLIDAKGKRVAVIGGGDTGSDCVGTANRQGAASVVQLELLPKPSGSRTAEFPWPKYPLLLKTTSSHEEGCERQWSVATGKFLGKGGAVSRLSCVKVEWEKDAQGRPAMKEVPGSGFEIEADLVVLALGFLFPQKKGLIEALALELDGRGNVKTDETCRTSVQQVFAAGDMRRGQSLIVWAVSEGRRAAHFIDRFLMGKTSLPLA
ncbi:MAG: glutamate synthase subunit beta [Endomicrobiales bacterium]